MPLGTHPGTPFPGYFANPRGFNGDGNRVKATLNGTTIVYLGNYVVPGDPYPRDFKWDETTSTLTKYYYAGATRIAVRGTYLRYTLSDHLGSTTVSVTGVGAYQSELRYKPWGETRYSDGTPPTRYQYTGQYSYTTEFGLYFYNARWYDPALGRFAQADTLVPEPGDDSASSAQAPQAWDRYAFVYNNPVRYVDPSGHLVCSDPHVAAGDCSDEGAGLWRFGITIADPEEWKERDREAIKAAAFSTGRKLAGQLGGDPWTAFRKVHGEIRFSMEKTTEKEWSCTRTGGGVTCYNARGNVTPRLIVHEFGHVFNAHLVNLGLANPYDELGNATIVDAEGKQVQGKNANGVWQRTFIGYISDRAPGVYHGRRYSDSNSPGEDFADMYMNWVFSTFATDDAGAARYNWMETHMAEWLDLIP